VTLLECQANCPEVLERMEVWIDGGVRRGTDVLKAICLGASGVLLGRPFLYAVGYGQEGVEHAVESEFALPTPLWWLYREMSGSLTLCVSYSHSRRAGDGHADDWDHIAGSGTSRSIEHGGTRPLRL
jgi:hypothetical protein